MKFRSTRAVAAALVTGSAIFAAVAPAVATPATTPFFFDSARTALRVLLMPSIVRTNSDLAKYQLCWRLYEWVNFGKYDYNCHR